MNTSAKKSGPIVYLLRLQTGKHFYIGATINLKTRLKEHSQTPVTEEGSAFPTKTYGFSGLEKDILALFPCQSFKEALKLEHQLVQKYIALCPDTAIFGGGVTFNTSRPPHFFEQRSILLTYGGF